MAANTRAKALGYGLNDLVTYGEMQTIQVQAAQSVNRTNTATRWRSMPYCVAGLCNGMYVIGGTTLSYNPATIAGGDITYSLVGLPDGHVIDGIRVTLDPTDDHGSNMPEYVPSIIFRRVSKSNATVSDISTVAYTLSDAATYQAGFTLSTTFSSITIDSSDYTYLVVLTPEYGNNAKAGTTVCGVQAHVTIDSTEGGPDYLFW